MKNLKKISALILALMLVLSLSAAALADGAGLTAHDATATDNEVVRILKEITVYNPANSTVNEPTATFTYTIASVADSDPKHTVTDANSTVVQVKPGVITGVTMTSQTNSTAAASTSLTYSPTNTNGASSTTEQLSATPAGTANTKWVDINFSGVNFGAAGVYRYQITEGTTSAYTNNGVVEGNTGHTRYLDVYVKQADGFTDGTTAAQWAVYGYSLFTADENIAPANEGDIAAKTTAYKTTGFVADDSATSASDDKFADAYYTFNVTIGKTLVNDFALNAHQFPFKVTFANTNVTANVLPIVTATSGNTTAPVLSAGDVNAIALDGTSATANDQIKIANGGSVTFTGIPAGTTLTIEEQNDVTGTYYTVTTSGGTTNEADGVVVAWDTWTNATAYADWTTVTAAQAAKERTDTMSSDSNVTVTFTNTLKEISPTGVVLRIAPFAMIFAASWPR